MTLNTTQLCKISRDFYKKHKGIIKDIILFGSVLRGKDNPSDIDILIVFINNINKDIEYEFKKKISRIVSNASIISKTQDSLHDSSFSAREAILFEGYSLINKKPIASLSGFESLGIFIYQTKKLNNVDKTRFYYALNGRSGAKGVIYLLNAIKLSDNIIAVPLSQTENTKEFFTRWNIDYTYVPSLIPSRLAKKHIIGKVR